jgi:hypothetical protein
MERLIQSFTKLPMGLPGTEARLSRDAMTIANVIPLWRHMFWLAAVFTALVVSVEVRLDVQQLRKDLDRNERSQRSADVVNDRLRLEYDSRRRAESVAAVASRMGIEETVEIVRIVEPK